MSKKMTPAERYKDEVRKLVFQKHGKSLSAAGIDDSMLNFARGQGLDAATFVGMVSRFSEVAAMAKYAREVLTPEELDALEAEFPGDGGGSNGANGNGNGKLRHNPAHTQFYSDDDDMTPAQRERMARLLAVEEAAMKMPSPRKNPSPRCPKCKSRKVAPVGPDYPGRWDCLDCRHGFGAAVPSPRCPKCKSREVVPVGPDYPGHWDCLDCRHAWGSRRNPPLRGIIPLRERRRRNPGLFENIEYGPPKKLKRIGKGSCANCTKVRGGKLTGGLKTLKYHREGKVPHPEGGSYPVGVSFCSLECAKKWRPRSTGRVVEAATHSKGGTPRSQVRMKPPKKGRSAPKIARAVAGPASARKKALEKALEKVAEMREYSSVGGRRARDPMADMLEKAAKTAAKREGMTKRERDSARRQAEAERRVAARGPSKAHKGHPSVTDPVKWEKSVIQIEEETGKPQSKFTRREWSWAMSRYSGRRDAKVKKHRAKRYVVAPASVTKPTTSQCEAVGYFRTLHGDAMPAAAKLPPGVYKVFEVFVNESKSPPEVVEVTGSFWNVTVK